jgi:hypothetical protein
VADLDIEDILQTALDAVKGKKTQAKIDEALTRKFTLAELSAAYRDANDEERAEFRNTFGGTPRQVVDETKPKDEPKSKPKPKLREVPPPEPKPMREGRKSGQAYDWDVDEDGHQFSLGFARVYSGPDEDDEIELPPAPEPEGDTGAAA